MAVVQGSEPSTRYERILIYADPKSGKTRLATSLPDRFGEIIYIAWDPGTEQLGPVLPQYRSRIHIIRSVSEPNKPYTPDKDAFQIALNDWSKPYPNAKTIVWDHMTATAEDCLQAVADSSQFSQQHVSIQAGPGKLNLPMEGDYGAVHGIIDRLTTFLFRQPMHLIILCHAATAELKDGTGAIGGPATIGKASVRKYAGRFDTVIRLGRKLDGDKNKFTAYTDNHARIWTAGIRSRLASNPIPSFDLSTDPRNFWHIYDQHFLNQEVEPVTAK